MAAPRILRERRWFVWHGILFEEPNPTGSRPSDLIGLYRKWQRFIQEGNPTPVSKATHEITLAHFPTDRFLRSNMTCPHQFSTQGAVLRPISQCEFRSLVCVPSGLPLWVSLFAFNISIHNLSGFLLDGRSPELIISRGVVFGYNIARACFDFQRCRLVRPCNPS